MKGGETKWRMPQNLINIYDFARPENDRISTRTAQQLMQQWKPMVAGFRLTQIIDRFGYNIAIMIAAEQQWNCTALIMTHIIGKG